MTKLEVGDWVRLPRLDYGCRYGIVLKIMEDERWSGAIIQTDGCNELLVDRTEISRRRDQFWRPHAYFPMRKRLPYGRYNTDNGYVLYNREYEPLFRFSATGWSACERSEQIRHHSQSWFFNDGNPPWVSHATFEACVAELPKVGSVYNRPWAGVRPDEDVDMEAEIAAEV